MGKLLIIDTETGGLDPFRHSILSLGAVVWEDGILGERIEIPIWEQNVSVTSEAININRIDLNNQFLIGFSPQRAERQFLIFLEDNFDGVKQKIDLVGHNVGFDIKFLSRLFRLANTGKTIEQIFSHRVLDTAGIVKFLILANRLPLSGASSTEAFKYFGIECNRHTALGDAMATGELLNKLLELEKV